MAGVVVAMLCNLLEFIIEIRKNSQDNKVCVMHDPAYIINILKLYIYIYW